MMEHLLFLPQPLGLEFRQPPFLLTAIWVEYTQAPQRSHYSVSIFKEEEGDIWAASFNTLEEAKACFEARRADLERGVVPEMPERK